MIKKSKKYYKIVLDNIKKCFYNECVSCEKATKKLTVNPRKVSRSI